jgi:creatinine amidohydrolase/Fe(II)-dependent formamide hydrolase-like protein
MKAVAVRLNAEWEGNPRVHYIPEYYDYPGVLKFVEDQGIEQEFEGIHDEYGISSILMAVDPELVRMEQRLDKGLFIINGVDMSPAEKTIRIGKEIIEMRANQTVEAIRKSTSNR